MYDLCRERYDLVQISYWNAYENYLRVTPIRSGDSVISQMKWVSNTKKGGTATYSNARPFRLQ